MKPGRVRLAAGEEAVAAATVGIAVAVGVTAVVAAANPAGKHELR